MKRKTNISVQDNRGIRVTPSIILGDKFEGYASGDLLDANAVKELCYDAPSDIPDGSITTAKLADGAVTSAKLDNDIVKNLDDLTDTVDTLYKVELEQVTIEIHAGDVLWDDGSVSGNIETEMASGKLPKGICVARGDQFEDGKARFVSAVPVVHDGSFDIVWDENGSTETRLRNYITEDSAKNDYYGQQNASKLVGESFYAANSCRSYSPGVYEGKWYLPAFGELCYVSTNYLAYYNTISRIQNIDPNAATLIRDYVWSSTQCDIEHAWLIGFMKNGTIEGGFSTYKNRLFLVFAFLSLPAKQVSGLVSDNTNNIKSENEAVAAALTDLQFKIDVVNSRIDNIQQQINNL